MSSNAASAERSSSARQPPLPPGPAGWPLLGSIPAIARIGMPEMLRQSRERYGDVVRLKVAGRTMILLAHPDHVRHVLYDKRDNYFKGPTYDSFRLLAGNGMLTSEGDFWKRQRRLAAPAFHKDAIAALGKLMTGDTVDMLAEWDQTDSPTRFDLHEAM